MKKIYSYYIGGKIKEHHVFLQTEIKCSYCGEKIYLDYEINQKKVIKKCHNCKKENCILIKKKNL
ncbi:hypothetical protein H2274_07030 [Campylobacter sp. W0049]|uniref:hypothetical protein n=1 Tax=Campylobacter molothri TaxID=1032242 RepID=UPI00301CB5D0|nr:hypothetical protein [Campylobacter sp. W0049]